MVLGVQKTVLDRIAHTLNDTFFSTFELFFSKMAKFFCAGHEVLTSISLQRCNSKVSVRPIHMWMVEENGNAKTEVERLETEIESLTSHQPDILAEIGVEVEYHSIFCCVDGRMSC